MTSSGRGSHACFASRRWRALALGGRVALASFVGCGPHQGKLVVDPWEPLAEGAWTLDPGKENAAWCTTIALGEETYIAAVRPLASPGTHHIGLTVAEPQDGDDCTKGQFGPRTLYASGPGAGELRMPPGVAMHLPRGTALHLNLHVYNATQARLDGVSGIEIVRARPSNVVHEAGFVLAGPASVTLPPAKRTTIAHTCTIVADQTAFALIPLMHELGVQFKTTILVGGAPHVLFDGAFHFEEQSQVPLAPVTLRAGDAITTECTYENTKYHPVIPGHPGDEICFSALLRYPHTARVECAEPDDSAPPR
jgi:hypothetical protein